MLVDTPTARLVPEVIDDELGALEGSVAVTERDIDPGIPEADDVGKAALGDRCDEPGMLVDLPAARPIAKVGQDKPWRCIERPSRATERRPDTGVAEADDRIVAAPGDIREQTGVATDKPPG